MSRHLWTVTDYWYLLTRNHHRKNRALVCKFLVVLPNWNKYNNLNFLILRSWPQIDWNSNLRLKVFNKEKCASAHSIADAFQLLLLSFWKITEREKRQPKMHFSVSLQRQMAGWLYKHSPAMKLWYINQVEKGQIATLWRLCIWCFQVLILCHWLCATANTQSSNLVNSHVLLPH